MRQDSANIYPQRPSLWAHARKLTSVRLFVMLALAGFLGMSLPVDEAHANRKYASIVMEANTGRILYSRNADKKLHPASLTKVMTLLLTFEALENGHISRRDRVYVSRRAASMVPSKLGLSRGSTIRVEDAIYALVTKSANDIAVALAEHLAGTEWRFSRLMTQKAQQIGMSNTRFQNASGLYHPHQKSTARDMAILSRYVILNYPRYYRYFSTSSFSYKGKTYNNHNRLMARYRGMDGLKTGYIGAAGFNLAASAVRGDNRLIGVVFGGKTTRSRDKHMARILDSSFARLSRLRVAHANIPVPEEKPEEFRGASSVAIASSAHTQSQTASKAKPKTTLIALTDVPLPAQKPKDIIFKDSSSFRLARFEASAPAPSPVSDHAAAISQKPKLSTDAETIPPEHFEMLAKVLGSEKFDEVVGQGDYDPVVLSRIETGLLALSAHTGENKFAPAAKLSPPTLPHPHKTPLTSPQTTPPPGNESGIITFGRRVFASFFQFGDDVKMNGNINHPGTHNFKSKEAYGKRLINGLPVPPMLPENRLWDEARQNSWSVQLGAYNDRGHTKRVLDNALTQLPPDISDAKALVIPLRDGTKIVYRARLTRLAKDEARSVCRNFSDCMMIAP